MAQLKSTTINGSLTLPNNMIWIQGGSAAGGDSNRLSTAKGMPGSMQHGKGQRGVQIYSNGIAMADPYNGNTNSDSAWIRHLETTTDAGSLEIAVGDNSGDDIISEQIYFAYYNTENNIGNRVDVPRDNGTLALTKQLPKFTDTTIDYAS